MITSIFQTTLLSRCAKYRYPTDRGHKQITRRLSSILKTSYIKKNNLIPFIKTLWYNLTLLLCLCFFGQAKAQTFFFEDFSSNNAGWTLGPEWQIGSATASFGQSTGNPDPSQDYTPTSDNGVAGAVIGGNISTAQHDYYYLTSPEINLSGVTACLNLSFRRWLNSDYDPYMKNLVQVYDGTNWITIWESGGSPGIQDNSWNLQEFNITPYVNANFRVRFGYRVGSAGVFTASGWNLDDVTISSIIPGSVPTVTSSHPTTCGGSDGSITLAGFTADKTYSVTYKKNSTAVAAANFTSDANGKITLTNLDAGNYTDITATYGTCVSNAVSATLTDPAKPSLTLSILPDICAGATVFTIPYTSPLQSPNKFTISGTGITTVTDADLTNPITVPLSFGASGSSIVFTLTLKNTTTNCVSDNISGSVNVNPASVGGDIAGSATVCTGTNSTLLTLSGQTGDILKWQSADNANFTNPTDIANTTTQYTTANLTQTTYYRAVVKNGVCEAANSTSATITVNPDAAGGSIAGSATVCTGTNSTLLTLSGQTGDIQKWQSADNSNFTNPTDITNTTHQYTAANLILTTYFRAVVKNGVCEAANSTSATITVNPASVGGSIAGSATVCTGTNSTLLTLSGQTGDIQKWQSADNSNFTNPTDITNTTNQYTAANLTQTNYYRAVVKNGNCEGAYSTPASVVVGPAPTAALTASQTEVCPNTQITLTPNCSVPGATVNWNPGAPTVTPDAATIPYVYKASCTLNGCTGNESSVEVRTHRILVDMKTVGPGMLPQPLISAVKDNLAPANTITASPASRRWTFVATGCAASESAVFKLMGPVNFSSIDNGTPYALFANEGNNYYAIDHPNYGTGGSFPNGTYSLTVELRSQDGVGGPFPKNRVATGSLLASRTLQFTVTDPPSIVGSRQGVGGSESFIPDRLGFAEISPNPFAHTLRLKLTDAKDQSVYVSLVDASGQTLLQRSFVPQTQQHQEEFEVSHLNNGMYFLKVNTHDKQTTLKVVKVE